jgi:hypothetical protein
MENRTARLTRRGWIVLVLIPGIVIGLLFAYVTRDVCYVGSEYGNTLGYGSCMEQIDRVIQEGR